MNFLLKVIAFITMVSVVSCHSSEDKNKAKGPSIEGKKIDSATGLIAHYIDIEPQKVFIMMNGEVLNHTDIPIGESFTIINQRVKGMTVKFEHISIGCSILIEDSTGKKVFSNPDIYAKSSERDPSDASFLACKVVTNDSMKWEAHYKVTVVFWDKYGDGKIENVVTIRPIDIP